MDETETIVSGKILDSTNAPVPACSVWVRSLELSAKPVALAKVRLDVNPNALDNVLVTDSSGAFEFAGLPAGSYVLMAYSHTGGIQHRFTLKTCDTLGQDIPLVLAPLQTLTLHLDSAMIGATVTIPELALTIPVTDPDITIPAVPSGSYTVRSTSLAQDSLVVQSTPVNSAPDTVSLSTAADTVLWDSVGTMGYVTDSRDGSVYRVTQIGSIVWFAQNLHYAALGSTCSPYDFYQATTCEGWGRYYSYSRAFACPSGWHLATLADWDYLRKLAASELLAGTLLKNATGWNSGTGENYDGFAVLPAGSATSPTFGTAATFWTADEVATGLAQAIQFTADNASTVTTAIDETEGFSVRCAQD